MGELAAAAVFCVLYLCAFVAAALVRRRFPRWPEGSRKVLHLLCGLISAPTPLFIRSWWIPAAACAAFLIVMTVSKLTHRLSEVHDVGRSSVGAFLFPLSVFLLFQIARDRLDCYAVGVLVLSVSDTAAALVGCRFGASALRVCGSRKSMEGSLSFFAVTWIVVNVVLLLTARVPASQVMEIGFVTASVMTGVELLCPWGTDNLLVPLGAAFIVERMTGISPAACAPWVAGVLLAEGAVAILAFARGTRVRFLAPGSSGAEGGPQ
jgi:dolichol kinase